MKKFLGKQSWKSIITIWLLILGLVTGVQIVKINLDNRSKAEGDSVVVEEDGEQFKNMCGEADEIPSLSRPVENLCRVGTPVWIDSVATAGLYRWRCIDETTGESGECSAVLDN